MKVAIYARVSTDDKDQNPQRQKLKAEQYADLHNHEVVEYAEDYITGDSNPFDREGFKKCLEKNPEGIIIYDISRFSREHPTKVLRRISELRDRGIKIISITEAAFNMEGEMSDLIQYILSWFNNYFLKKLKESVKSGMQRARLEGKQIGRTPKKYNKRRAYYLLFIEKVSQRKAAKELEVPLATLNRFKKVCEKEGGLFINGVKCSNTDVKGTNKE